MFLFTLFLICSTRKSIGASYLFRLVGDAEATLSQHPPNAVLAMLQQAAR